MLRIRLTRRGAKKNPHYRVVVTERSSPRDGRFQEIVGHYNPALEPVQLHLDLERVDHWIEKGAQPTRTVKTLIRRVRAQGQPEAVTVEKVAEKESQAEPEKVVEEEAQAKPPCWGQMLTVLLTKGDSRAIEQAKDKLSLPLHIYSLLYLRKHFCIGKGRLRVVD